MTATDTIQGLLAALDDNPDDRHLLLVLADAYDDVSYGTGDGWRALVATVRRPHYWDGGSTWGWCTWVGMDRRLGYKSWRQYCDLTSEWLWLCIGHHNRFPVDACTDIGDGDVLCGPTASGAYVAAAEAFLRLPLQRRCELLEGRL